MPIKPSNRTDIPSTLKRRLPKDVRREIRQIENMAFDPPALPEKEIKKAR